MRALLGATLLLASVSLARAAPQADPLASPMWNDMVERILDGGPVVFDDRVKVVVPSVVEDQAQVPVTADARALEGVETLVVFADLNPIQHVLTLNPAKAAAYVSFRMKVEQGTPIRAAARTADGVWRVGGVYLDAAGGGCSAPAAAREKSDWHLSLGETNGKIWQAVDGSARVRFRIRHPMDTGLTHDGIPAYYIERLVLSHADGTPLASLDMFEPVSEDPTLTVQVRLPGRDAAVDIEGRDTNGLVYKSRILASQDQSEAASSAGDPTP